MTEPPQNPWKTLDALAHKRRDGQLEGQDGISAALPGEGYYSVPAYVDIHRCSIISRDTCASLALHCTALQIGIRKERPSTPPSPATPNPQPPTPNPCRTALYHDLQLGKSWPSRAIDLPYSTCTFRGLEGPLLTGSVDGALAIG